MDRTGHAFKAQLEDLLALERSDATPAELARVYAVCVTAYRAANLRAMVVSQVPFRVVDAKGEPLEDHPLNALFRDNLGIAEALERSELTLCFWGHTLLYKRRLARQPGVADLQWLNPQLYRPHFDTRAQPVLSGFDLLVRRSDLDPADAVFMHGVDLTTTSAASRRSFRNRPVQLRLQAVRSRNLVVEPPNRSYGSVRAIGRHGRAGAGQRFNSKFTWPDWRLLSPLARAPYPVHSLAKRGA